ncbi:ROK family transcriptional regulator [Streptomyces indicus]|uniref:Sugar kinase of the NBD/HSP70 family, may contain an N-terminal HTH domain n=1 Tax=Streptomyces indicus TaxID=417292 RepID=A0A1G8XBF6_9ACTN|nr:ROK family transcriptional regulator [Streptomyces indicus]SDJ87080.1 Sugar kinase of the NBD/HSP70 family, may contain an N-terminal HTH domain [Streptomyces indicus]
MPASPRTARAINDRLALRLLLQEPLTAGQLKERTGLSRPTVADLVERLQDAGLIQVVGEAGAERRGPNAKLYGIVADIAHLAALDVRTMGVSVVVSDLLGTVLAEASLPIDETSGTQIAVERAVALLDETVRSAGVAELHSVGIGAPGLIDPASGELRDSSGLPAWHRRLVAALQKERPATVLVENETNLAAVAERRSGAGRDRDTFVLLWLGHGVGAAVLLDGRLRRGASGGAGELGFLPVPGTSGLPSAVDCAGGFHALASSAAIVRLAAECGVSGPDEAGAGPAGEGVVRAAVEALAEPHSPRGKAAAGFLDTLADRVALAVAATAAVLDPGCVVLGGEIGCAGGPALARRVEERVAALSPLHTEVRAGELGGGAVLRGALLAAQEAAQEALFPSES